MLSVLGRLISEELGDIKYGNYFDCYRSRNRGTDKKRAKSEEIFRDIYADLKDKDICSLNLMLERLLNTIYLSLRISRQFGLVLLGFAATVVILCFLNLNTGILIGGIVLATICLIFKAYEFVINKYCYIDAHIILIYKTVLFHLILTYDLRKIL